MCFRIPALLLTLLALPWAAEPLIAQTAEEGARIRVQHQSHPQITGTLARIGPDTIWLRRARYQPLVPIAISDVERMHVSERATRPQGARKWAIRGSVVGAALGIVTCLADQPNCTAEISDGGLAEGLVGSALFIGGGSAFIGAVVGAVLPGRRWREVDVP